MRRATSCPATRDIALELGCAAHDGAGRGNEGLGMCGEVGGGGGARAMQDLWGSAARFWSSASGKGGTPLSAPIPSPPPPPSTFRSPGARSNNGAPRYNYQLMQPRSGGKPPIAVMEAVFRDPASPVRNAAPWKKALHPRRQNRPPNSLRGPLDRPRRPAPRVLGVDLTSRSANEWLVPSTRPLQPHRSQVFSDERRRRKRQAPRDTRWRRLIRHRADDLDRRGSDHDGTGRGRPGLSALSQELSSPDRRAVNRLPWKRPSVIL